MLRLYLSHFPGQRCSAFQLSAFSDRPALETWRTIKSGLNIAEPTGQFTSSPGAPALSGVVERLEVTDPDLLRIRKSSPQIVAALAGMGGEEPELLLRLDRPAPGLAHVFSMAMGDQTLVSMRFHLYGDTGAAIAADAKRAWNDWLAERFPQVMAQ
jgi:hypothetical protein